MLISGIGYDNHRLEGGNGLILAGVKIPYTKSFLAHSDGDVLIHALIDSLLGAGGLGNIGQLFPDTDEKYKNISSLQLLAETKELLDKSNITVQYIDAVVIAQNPKLSPYIEAMQQNLSKVLSISTDRISIKPKTNEGLDATGKEEAVAVFVVSTVERSFS